MAGGKAVSEINDWFYTWLAFIVVWVILAVGACLIADVRQRLDRIEIQLKIVKPPEATKP